MIPATKRTINSCLRCRVRKIRCGRERPECQNCARYGHSCRYAPTPTESNSTRPEGNEGYNELAQRLSHLEAVVARLAGTASEGSPPEGSAVSTAGNVHIVDSEPRLLSGSYWKQLAAQHPDFNALLDANQDEQPPFKRVQPSRPLNLFVAPDPEFYPHAYIPPLPEAERLYAIFLDRVDPVVRIIHKPTFLEEMQEYYLQIRQDNEIDKRSTAAFEALLFTVLFGALASLSEEEHWGPSPAGQETAPGHVKRGCLQALRLAIEQSLIRSELLERPSLHSISACCLFLFITCDETDVPYHYCLTGLLLRVARSFSLHIDPQALADRRRIQKPAQAPFSAVVVEVRRRLWHVIIHPESLDFMSSEARGVDPESIGIQTWPTTLMPALPGNMNDEDIVEEAQENKNNARFTDMTMSLVRYQLSLGLRQLVTTPVPPSGSDTIQKCLDGTVEMVERHYLQYCHASDPIQTVTLELGRLGGYKLRLHVYHRFLKERDGINTSYWSPSRKRAMGNAKDLISSYQTLLADPNIRRFHWHIRRHSQLHGMLHIINELSTIDTSNLSVDTHILCKQAWETIADVEMKSDSAEENSKEKRLWTFLHNLRERVRLRLYTQEFISRGLSTNSGEVDDNSLMSGIDGTNLLESLFGGKEPWKLTSLVQVGRDD
ncbi:hypothetical protein N7447_004894 [Penicillium robsamsonii]|uniref:uncharacterized protein n=1 Tax=Penicillium robsamsonii TaxID=1792511 RepID=UPI0025466DF0|nr:uncharacterized protein N7447_004894 [Penicillium robsamsonii]KAJ5822554.1 hypothetical protein N7447_004894 [Penicillium robsamsonii]